MKAAQIRAARGLLGWSREELARKSGVATSGIEHLEAAAKSNSPESDGIVDAVVSALEAGGVIFLEDGALTDGGPGVRLVVTVPADDLRETVQYPEFLSPDASTGSGG